MSYTRIHRLLRIITIIQSGDQVNAKRLAEMCDTSERNIYRDINELREAGVPISHEPDLGGYKIRRDFFMPPVQLTLDEALALAALGEHISGKEQIPFLTPARRAVHKIESLLPPAVQQELHKQLATMEIQTAPSMPPDSVEDVYARVREAIAQRRILRCEYEPVASSDDEQGEFDLHPYTLLFSVRAWYVIGYRSDRDDLRSLKLGRFAKLQLTERTYEMPDDFNLSKHLGNAWRMIRDGDDVEIELWFDETFAQTIAETLWHHTQEIEWHDDESCTFRCTVAGLSEIVWWILSMGPHCQVRKPPELAEQVRDLAARTASLYDGA